MSKKALIDPNTTSIKYISAWTSETDDDGNTFYVPTYSDIPNAQRVAQVEDATFEIASPLFWVDCDDSTVADEWYYDTSDSTVKPIAPLNVAQPS